MNSLSKAPQFIVSTEEFTLLKAGVNGAIIRPFKQEICDVVGVLRDGVWMDIKLCEPHLEIHDGLLKATARGFATPREDVLLRPIVPDTLPGRRVSFGLYSQVVSIDWSTLSCEYQTEVGAAGVLCLDLHALIRANTAELLKLIDGKMIPDLLGVAPIDDLVFAQFVSAMDRLVALGRARIVVGLGHGSVASIDLSPLGKVKAGMLRMSPEQVLSYWDRSPSGREHPSVTNPWVWSWNVQDVEWVSDWGVIAYSMSDGT